MLERTKGAMPNNMYIITRKSGNVVHYITDYGTSTDKNKASIFETKAEAEEHLKKIASFVTFKIERL